MPKRITDPIRWSALTEIVRRESCHYIERRDNDDDICPRFLETAVPCPCRPFDRTYDRIAWPYPVVPPLLRKKEE
jgi:hypothetical protein